MLKKINWCTNKHLKFTHYSIIKITSGALKFSIKNFRLCCEYTIDIRFRILLANKKLENLYKSLSSLQFLHGLWEPGLFFKVPWWRKEVDSNNIFKCRWSCVINKKNMKDYSTVELKERQKLMTDITKQAAETRMYNFARNNFSWKLTIQNCYQNVIQIDSVKRLRWSFFVKIVNSPKLSTISTKQVHRRCSTGF